MSEARDSLADDILGLLGEAGLSPEVASSKASLSRNTVRNWVGTDRRKPTPDSLRKFCEMMSRELGRRVVLTQAGDIPAQDQYWRLPWPVLAPPAPNELFMTIDPPSLTCGIVNTSLSFVRDAYMFMRWSRGDGWRFDELPMGDIPPQKTREITISPEGAQRSFPAFQFTDERGNIWMREFTGHTHLAWWRGKRTSSDEVVPPLDEPWVTALHRLRQESANMRNRSNVVGPSDT